MDQQYVDVGKKGDSYLIMLPGLDGLQRTDPVLHLFPVLGTEDEPTERSDHLKEEGGVRSWVSEGYRQREGGRKREVETERKRFYSALLLSPPSH